LQFETADSMGANFINTILEALGTALPGIIAGLDPDARVEVLMAILSNYTPHCKVSLQVSCPVEELLWSTEMLPDDFARRMMLAARIAAHDVSRAVTHNKGIMNGVDAVVLATGNDFRAVEASVHAYAARDGQYRSLSRVDIQDGQFRMELSLPLALGTVGGLTSLHPLAARSLEILGKPSALTLMKLAAALGLANNFAAMAALVTSGIQKGHMKMHLGNILSSLKVTDDDQRQKVAAYFQDKTVSVAAVKQFLGMD
jgi:hydroxymethylglutaryl-CoA reductase